MTPAPRNVRGIFVAAALAAAALFFRTPAAAIITQVAAPPSAYSPATASVGHWHFDESTGTIAADASGNGNTAAVTCLPALCVSTPTFSAGNPGLGAAVTFTGLTDSLVRAPNIGAYNFTNNLTVSAWVNPSSVVQPNGAGIVVRGNGVTDNFALEVSGGVYRFVATPAKIVSSTNSIAAGAWIHLIGVHDSGAGTATLYVNGQQASTVGTVPLRAASAAPISIGNRQSAGAAYDRGFLGSIDAVRVQNVALNAAQALAEYEGSRVSTAVAPAPNNNIQIGLAPNAFGAAANIRVTIDPLTTPITITPTILNAGLTVIPAGLTLLPNSLVEIVPDIAGVPFTQNMGSSASVSMPYADANGDNVIDGVTPTLAASGIKIYTLNTTVNRWELLPSFLDPITKRVTVTTPHFSVFGMFAPQTFGAALSQVRIYPIPWKPGSGGRFDAPVITFDRLPTTGSIRILTLTGEHVKEFAYDSTFAGTITWDGRTSSGRRAVNGVYFARISGDGGVLAMHKFAIER